MSGQDSIDVTLAYVDPSLLSCWQEMVKRGEEGTLMLKHSRGQVTATLQSTNPLWVFISLFGKWNIFFFKLIL